MGSSETASIPWPKSKTLPASPCSPPIVSSPPHPPTPSSTAPARLAPPNLTKSRRLKITELPLSSTGATTVASTRSLTCLPCESLLCDPQIPHPSRCPTLLNRLYHASTAVKARHGDERITSLLSSTEGSMSRQEPRWPRDSFLDGNGYCGGSVSQKPVGREGYGRERGPEPRTPSLGEAAVLVVCGRL